MDGDTENLSLEDISAEDVQEINDLQEEEIPVVVVIISRRPLVLPEGHFDWVAVVAAWLPGTEGQGISDVLPGDYNFSGKLPFSWPKDESQLPLNKNSTDENEYDPLFEYNHGLKMDL